MLKLRIRKWNGKCRKHPNFDPDKTGRGGVKGGCKECNLLVDVWELSGQLNMKIRDAAKVLPATRERKPKPPREVQIGLFEEPAACSSR